MWQLLRELKVLNLDWTWNSLVIKIIMKPHIPHSLVSRDLCCTSYPPLSFSLCTVKMCSQELENLHQQ